MSNVPTTTKALIAIVSIIILASGIFVLTKSRPVETPSISTSSSSVSSLISSSPKAIMSSSSQIQTVSSSSQAVSKIVEVTKTSEVLIKSKIETSIKNVSISGTFNSPNTAITLPCKDYYPTLTGANPAPFAPKYKEFINSCNEIGASVSIFKLINGEGKFVDATLEYINQ